jgi:KDO2-lipid IV(A) lauroyltransferase
MRLAQPMPETPAGHAAWVNAAMEDMIRRFPEQYLWGYNRYKAPPGSGMAPDRAETIAQA